MTTLQFPAAQRDRLRVLVRDNLRPATTEAGVLVGTDTWTWTPDLTAQEQTTLQALVDLSESPVTVTPAEWQAIRSQMQTLRDLRQMGRNAFLALTAAERDRLLYDASSATTTILLALLRD